MMESHYGATGGAMTETEFQRLAQSIGSNIQKIQQNVSSIKRMIEQIGTPQDNQQFQQQLHQIQHYTGQLAKDTSKHLKDLSTSQPGEDRTWRMQRERLQNDFTKALNSFQSAQRTAAQKEKEVVKKAKASQGLQGPPGSGDPFDLEGTSSGQLAPGQSKTQMMLEEEYNIEQLQERERSIRQLESDIVDVNTIFKDLATMVHEQGEMVDSIEENVESTHIRVSEGADYLRQAENYRNKARKKKLIMACVGIIVLIILIIIIAHALS